MDKTVRKFLRVLLFQGSSLRFACAVVLGFGFSMAVILTTLGIMDGFDKTLKQGLKRSSGDISLYHENGSFIFDEPLKSLVVQSGIKDFATVVESEGFAIFDERSKGVLIKGIHAREFKDVTGINLDPLPGEVVIGTELADFFSLKKGDDIILSAFADGNDSTLLPVLNDFSVGGIVDHGIHQKDLRYVYMEQQALRELIGIGDEVHTLIIKSGGTDIEEQISLLHQSLGPSFHAVPFWNEFSILLQAVQVEKFMIALILQIIVVIAIFNVLAYVIFLNERRAKETFLFMALGMPRLHLVKSWNYFILLIWATSCLVSLGFCLLMGYGIENLPFLTLPSDVYYLSRLKIILSPASYFTVFSASLLWLFCITFLNFRHLKRRPIIQGLQKEFS